jgi:hypothetical protein
MSAIYVNPEFPASQDPRYVDICIPGKKVAALLARGGSIGNMTDLGGWTELDADDFLDAIVLEYVSILGDEAFVGNIVIEVVHAKSGIVVRRQLGAQ